MPPEKCQVHPTPPRHPLSLTALSPSLRSQEPSWWPVGNQGCKTHLPKHPDPGQCSHFAGAPGPVGRDTTTGQRAAIPREAWPSCAAAGQSLAWGLLLFPGASGDTHAPLLVSSHLLMQRGFTETGFLLLLAPKVPSRGGPGCPVCVQTPPSQTSVCCHPCHHDDAACLSQRGPGRPIAPGAPSSASTVGCPQTGAVQGSRG